MVKGFDKEKYIKMQTEKILERINQYNNKLYMEFGGKLLDDSNAERVLPGYNARCKVELLQKLKDKVEIILCISSKDIIKNRIRADIGITYDMEVLRLIDNLKSLDLDINSVVVTQYDGQPQAELFKNKLERRNIRVYTHTATKGYPTDVNIIVSDEGYGANTYIETTKPLVVVTAPGAGGGKLATCLSQLYHEYKRGIKAGYAKFETFPIWNLPLKHPVNVSYEVVTADLKDVNMIDSFYLEEYGKIAINYNRDLEVFPILKNILEKIMGVCDYKSPTDMGINMTGYCITDDEVVSNAARQEIIRRYYKALCMYKQGLIEEDVSMRIKVLMNEAKIDVSQRDVVAPALKVTEEKKLPAVAIKLDDGRVVTGRNTDILTAPASAVINAIKVLANISDDIKLLSPAILEPMMKLKGDLFENGRCLLNIYDVLLGLSTCVVTNSTIEHALAQVDKLEYCEAHASFMIQPTDESMFRSLKINLTQEPEYYSKNLYYSE